MKKTIRHRGMTLTKKQHARWHQSHPGKPPRISSTEHDALLRAAGIDEKWDRTWHAAHGDSGAAEGSSSAAPKPINPFAVGGAFLEYCVARGWLRREGTRRAARYFVTEVGRVELPKFGVKV